MPTSHCDKLVRAMSIPSALAHLALPALLHCAGSAPTLGLVAIHAAFRARPCWFRTWRGAAPYCSMSLLCLLLHLLALLPRAPRCSFPVSRLFCSVASFPDFATPAPRLHVSFPSLHCGRDFALLLFAYTDLGSAFPVVPFLGVYSSRFLSFLVPFPVGGYPRSSSHRALLVSRSSRWNVPSPSRTWHYSGPLCLASRGPVSCLCPSNVVCPWFVVTVDSRLNGVAARCSRMKSLAPALPTSSI